MSISFHPHGQISNTDIIMQHLSSYCILQVPSTTNPPLALPTELTPYQPHPHLLNTHNHIHRASSSLVSRISLFGFLRPSHKVRPRMYTTFGPKYKLETSETAKLNHAFAELPKVSKFGVYIYHQQTHPSHIRDDCTNHTTTPLYS